jgi:hypothetical protein
MRRALHAFRALLAISVLAASVWASVARAQSLTGLIDASYVNSRLTLTDPTGRTTDSSSSAFPQRYRLSYDQQFFPLLAVSASGIYQWTPATTTNAGVENEVNSNLWNVFLRAVVGPPVLNITPYYSRRQEFNMSRVVGGLSPFTPTLISQSFGAYAAWNPLGLPTLGLQFSRTEDFDSRRVTQDLTTDQVQLNANYLEIQDLSLRGSFRYVNQQDAIQSLSTSDLSANGQVMWNGAFAERRLTGAVIYNIGYRGTTVQASGGGFVSVQQFPSGGLSIVEVFPAIPSRVTLGPNPALIDGDTATSAGIDIGYSPVLAGDNNYRDVGVRFPAPITEVNQLRVWVDRPLPPEVSSTYAWTAWRSEDNDNWTEIPITGPVIFAPFNNRFEIPIPRTQATYLKVVTRPLQPAVTIDRQFANVFVTEVQTFLVVPASEAPRRSDQTTGNLNVNARLLLERDWNLAYDFASFISHSLSFSPDYWSVLNAFSAGRQLSRVWSVGARIERTDSGNQGLHEAVNRLSAQVSAEPIPGLGGSFMYTGQMQQLVVGNTLSNGFTLLGHADPYEGVTLMASITYSIARDALGRNTTGANALVGATITPLPAIVLSGSWTLQTSHISGGGFPDSSDRQGVLVGSISFTPIPAFFFSAGITRNGQSGQPTQNLANLAVGFSPFPQGQLLLNFNYNDALDSGAQSRARVFGPSLRWNIRPGTYLNASYIWSDTAQPALASAGTTFFTQLVIAIR